MAITISGFPFRASPINNVTPFTYRDGTTYLEELSGMQSFINSELVGTVNKVVNETVETLNSSLAEVDKVTGELSAEVKESLSSFDGRLVETLESIDGRVTEITGPVARQVVDEYISSPGTDFVFDKRYTTTIIASNYGVIGDGVTDDGPAILSALAAGAAKGIPVSLPHNAVIRVTAPVRIPSGSTIYANNATFTGSFDNFVVVIRDGSDVTITGRLNILATNPGTQAVRGLMVYNMARVDISELAIKATHPDAGATQRATGFECELVQGLKVGSVSIENFRYSSAFRTCGDIRIGSYTASNYLRSVYITNSTDIQFDKGNVRIAAPSATYSAGHNGVLIDATSHLATERIRFNNFSVYDAGEHGYRLGGNKKISDVVFNDCKAENVGGSGFKVLGGTQGDGNYHDMVSFNNCTVIDAGQVENVSAGFMIQFATRTKINNPVVRKNNKPFSTAFGIEIQAVDAVMVTNPDISNTINSGIKVGFVLGNMTNIVIDGGVITSNSGNCVTVDYTNRVLRRFKMMNFPELNISGEGYVFSSTAGASGSAVGLSIASWYSTTPAARQIDPNSTTSAFVADIIAPFGSGLDPYFKNASVWRDALADSHKVKRTGTWV